MSRRLALLTLTLAALLGLAGVVIWAPDYLSAQGFPLDDAWIHAVYGRELARSGILAYNPGVAATGTTAPLWSMLVALPHLCLTGPSVVSGIKLLGFLLHACTALMFFAALRGRSGESEGWAFAGALLIALDPDLLSASVSGMEIPLATLAAGATLWAVSRGSAVAITITAALAYLARPELAVVTLSVPLLDSAARLGRGMRAAAWAATGTTLAAAMLALRHWMASGLPLPATFYAKVDGSVPLASALSMGTDLLRQIPLANSLLLLAAMLGIALLFLRVGVDDAARLAAASFTSGVLFCLVSFVLVAPIDPGAFYHQRYVLPGVPLLIGPLPLLFATALRRSLPARAAYACAMALVVLCVVGLMRSAPARFAHLASDARNIDDVQVALGRHLADAAPEDVVWAVDAGAVRYFGNAFVVDVMGLNTPALLGPDAQTFLDAHPPRWIEVVPSWSALSSSGPPRLTRAIFTPRSPYTVTGFPVMRRHELVECDRTAASFRFAARGRIFAGVCQDSDSADRSRAAMAQLRGR